MRRGGLLSFFVIAVIVIVLGLFVFGTVFMLSNAFEIVRQSVEFSPLEDEVFVGNTERCIDSDRGIYFGRAGEVSYERRFLFLSWLLNLEDSCDGNELTEYYCTVDGVVKGIVTCSGSCVDGRCLS